MDIEDELEAKFVAAERSFLELEDKEFSQHEDIYQVRKLCSRGFIFLVRFAIPLIFDP